MHAHLQATRMLPSAVYLLDSKFTPFKLRTSPEFKRNITYFCSWLPYSTYVYLDFHLFHDKAKRTQQENLLLFLLPIRHSLLLLFSLFFEGREKMARRPYVSPEALYSSIMDSVGYLEIYSLKREYLPIFQSHRIKPIKPFRDGIYPIPKCT